MAQLPSLDGSPINLNALRDRARRDLLDVIDTARAGSLPHSFGSDVPSPRVDEETPLNAAPLSFPPLSPPTQHPGEKALVMDASLSGSLHLIIPPALLKARHPGYNARAICVTEGGILGRC